MFFPWDIQVSFPILFSRPGYSFLSRELNFNVFKPCAWSSLQAAELTALMFSCAYSGLFKPRYTKLLFILSFPLFLFRCLQWLGRLLSCQSGDIFHWTSEFISFYGRSWVLILSSLVIAVVNEISALVEARLSSLGTVPSQRVVHGRGGALSHGSRSEKITNHRSRVSK